MMMMIPWQQVFATPSMTALHLCRINMFFHWYIPTAGGSADELFPIPIYFKMNLTDPDPTNWYTFDFEHCTQVGHLSSPCKQGFLLKYSFRTFIVDVDDCIY